MLDLADFELVDAAAAAAARSLSVGFSARTRPAGTTRRRRSSGPSRPRKQIGWSVFIPPGTYQVNRHIVVDKVTVRGAGNWWTIIKGKVLPLAQPAPDKSVHSAPGFYGKYAADGGSTKVHLADFAIESDVRERIDTDQVNGIGGAIGGGSTIENLYLHHTKVGIWLDGPMDGLLIRNNVITDAIADGMNLHLGVSNVRATNNFVRNSGDDGLAMWSESNPDGLVNHHNVYDHNTVQTPVLANNIAIYGGRDNAVTDNLVADPIREGSTLHAGSRFNSTPFEGNADLRPQHHRPRRPAGPQLGPRARRDLALRVAVAHGRPDRDHRQLVPRLDVQRVPVRGRLAGEGRLRDDERCRAQHQGRRHRDQRGQRPGRRLGHASRTSTPATSARRSSTTAARSTSPARPEFDVRLVWPATTAAGPARPGAKTAPPSYRHRRRRLGRLIRGRPSAGARSLVALDPSDDGVPRT